MSKKQNKKRFKRSRSNYFKKVGYKALGGVKSLVLGAYRVIKERGLSLAHFAATLWVLYRVEELHFKMDMLMQGLVQMFMLSMSKMDVMLSGIAMELKNIVDLFGGSGV